MSRPAALRTAARVLLAPYLVVLGFIVFLPARSARRVTGIVGWAADVVASYGAPREPAAIVFEFLANIALFVPFGALIVLAWPKLGVWPPIVAALVVSTVIELVQLGLPSRVATISDVVANTTGAAIGVLLVMALRQRRLRTPDADADAPGTAPSDGGA
ncbi:VanZ family protein [Agromyces protaetiae]|nr:VanZ family protein [Agromyces protaetiae]